MNQKSSVHNRSYQFSLEIINLVGGFPEKRVYWVIGSQLLRSATSVGANLVEAKSSSSKKDFINYYQISLKSSNETTYWLRLLKDSKLVPKDEVDSLINEVIEIGKMIGASVLTLKGKR